MPKLNKPTLPPSEKKLPTPPERIAQGKPVLAPMLGGNAPLSTVHFLVHPGMSEIVALAESKGWREKGYPKVTVQWLELRWSADGWKTQHAVSSNDVPCPVVNGTFHLTNCPPGTTVSFAIHAGIACHAEQDTAGARDVADLWFNDGGRNYEQVTK